MWSCTAVRYLLLVVRFFARRAKKRTTAAMGSAMLPYILSRSKPCPEAPLSRSKGVTKWAGNAALVSPCGVKVIAIRLVTKRTGCDYVTTSAFDCLQECAEHVCGLNKPLARQALRLARMRALPRHRRLSWLGNRTWGAHQQLWTVCEECAVLIADQQITLR